MNAYTSAMVSYGNHQVAIENMVTDLIDEEDDLAAEEIEVEESDNKAGVQGGAV